MRVAGGRAETGMGEKKKKNKTKKIAITQRQKPFLARKIKQTDQILTSIISKNFLVEPLIGNFCHESQHCNALLLGRNVYISSDQDTIIGQIESMVIKEIDKNHFGSTNLLESP